VKPDAQLQTDVAEALFRDLRIDDAEVAVKAENGMVTLRGTVGSLGARLSAGKAARRVAGVRDVHNELEVRLLNAHGQKDAELRGSALSALSRNTLVPEDVDAAVEDGRLTLQGTVDDRYQRDEAEATVVNLTGITEVDNQIRVRNAAMAEDVSARIEEAFTRNARKEAREIKVDAVDGTVTLKGFVSSWYERNAAIDAAWAAPGVEKIDDQLGISG
jgi:osmotically-inducible protein OsmY